MCEVLLSVYLIGLVPYLTWYFFTKTLEAFSEATAKFILMSILVFSKLQTECYPQSVSHQLDVGQLLCQDQRVTAHTQDVLLSWLGLGFEDGALVSNRLAEFLSDFLVLAPCREGHQEILCHLANDLFHCSIFLSRRKKQQLLKTFSYCRRGSPENFCLGKINAHYPFSFIFSELITLWQMTLS